MNIEYRSQVVPKSHTFSIIIFWTPVTSNCFRIEYDWLNIQYILYFVERKEKV